MKVLAIRVWCVILIFEVFAYCKGMDRLHY